MEKEEKKQEKKGISKGKVAFYTGLALAAGITIGIFHKPIWNGTKKGFNVVGGLFKKNKPATVTTTVTGIGGSDMISEVKPEVTSVSTNGGNSYKNGGYRSFNSHQRVNNVNL